MVIRASKVFVAAAAAMGLLVAPVAVAVEKPETVAEPTGRLTGSGPDALPGKAREGRGAMFEGAGPLTGFDPVKHRVRIWNEEFRIAPSAAASLARELAGLGWHAGGSVEVAVQYVLRNGMVEEIAAFPGGGMP
jgi:hypothetical protein